MTRELDGTETPRQLRAIAANDASDNGVACEACYRENTVLIKLSGNEYVCDDAGDCVNTFLSFVKEDEL